MGELCTLVIWLADRFSKKMKRKSARERVLLLFLGLAVSVDAVSVGN